MSLTPSLSNREEKLELINCWLIERVNAEILELPVKTDGNNSAIREKFQKTISNLLEYWMEILAQLKEILAKNLNKTSGNYFNGLCT